MDANRTYGIEFEVVSSISKQKLTSKIKQAFNDNYLNHTISITGYGHAADSTNFTNWLCKIDASVRTAHFGFDHPIEVVSPVLKGKDGLKAIKIVGKVLNKYCKINKSCGLHIHHGVTNTEMINTAKAWIKAEKTVLKALPASRRTNRFAKTWQSIDINTLSTRKLAHLKHDRYTSLNLASFAVRGTIEFRCAAGTASADKAIQWLLFTQGFVSAAQINTNAELNTISKIKTFISGTAHAATTATSTFRSAAKNLAYQMISTGNHTAQEIIQALRESGYGFNSSKTLVYNSRRPEWTGFGQTTEYVNKKIRFIGSAVSIELDADYSEAGTWLESRYNFFQNAA